jgi:hypothetical protein
VAASGTSDTLTLSVSDGTLTLASTTGLSFGTTSNSSASITVNGTLANLSAAVNGLIYAPTPGFASGDTLQFALSDAGTGLSGTTGVAITVGNFPPPSVTVPSAASTNENSSVNFGKAISVTDTIASGTSDSISLTVANGKLTLSSTSGLSFGAGANGSSSMTVSGTLTNLNAALSGLLYAPNTGFSGHDTVQISVTDATDNQVGSGSVPVAVNPFVTSPVSASVLENSTYAFSTAGQNALTITDGAASTSSESMTLTVLHGKLTLSTSSGITVTAGTNGSSSMTVKGALANLNAALNGLVYAPTQFYTGTDTLTVSIADSSDNLSGSTSVAISVAMKRILPAVATSPVVTAVPSPAVPSPAIPADQEQSPSSDQWAAVTAAVDMLYD